MILFTGGGALAEEYRRQFACEIISARHVQDVELESYIRSASVVIHNSANINCNTFDEAVKDNFLLTKRILDTVHRVKPDMLFIYISSMSMLKTDDSYKDIEEMSLYTFSKYMGEIYCLRHDHKKLSAARFSTIFYRNPAKDGLSKLIHEAVYKREITIYDDGEAKRDFIPLEIGVQYLDKLTTRANIPRRINIVSGKQVRFKQAVEFLLEKIPGLKINNEQLPGATAVLSRFSGNGLAILGEINFSLQDCIATYIDELTHANTGIQ